MYSITLLIVSWCISRYRERTKIFSAFSKRRIPSCNSMTAFLCFNYFINFILFYQLFYFIHFKWKRERKWNKFIIQTRVKFTNCGNSVIILEDVTEILSKSKAFSVLLAMNGETSFDLGDGNTESIRSLKARLTGQDKIWISKETSIWSRTKWNRFMINEKLFFPKVIFISLQLAAKILRQGYLSDSH